MNEGITSEAKDFAATLPNVPALKDVLVGELATPGHWIVANVETNSFWPVNCQKIEYRAQEIWILPITQEHYPAVAMNAPKDADSKTCRLLLMRFLSILSWVEGQGYLVEHFGGGSLPIPFGRPKRIGVSICDEFDFSYFPQPTDEKTLLALALMREGLALNHAGYAFLSLYRVLEVAIKPKQRAPWIAEQIPLLNDREAKEALKALSDKGIDDVGRHLYETDRMAIAHANKKPIVDPDNVDDLWRLRAEIPIIRALARQAIEITFGIETPHTVWEKHLYELAGFKKAIGQEFVDRIAGGERIAEGTAVNIPRIRIVLRRQEPYPALSALNPVGVGQEDRSLVLQFASEDQTIRLLFRLDFVAERLQFDMFSDVAARDPGTAAGAQAIADLKRFLNAYFGNGELQIYDADTGELLSRKDPYIPVNMMQDHKAAEAEVAHWTQLAEARRLSETTQISPTV